MSAQPYPIHGYLIRDGNTPVLAVAPMWQSYGHLAIEVAYALQAAKDAGADLWLIPPPEGTANDALYHLRLPEGGKVRVFGPPEGYDWFSNLRRLGVRPWSGCKPRTQADITNPSRYFFRKKLAALPPLRLPDELAAQACQQLQAMGIDLERPWVAVHAKHGTVRGVDIATYTPSTNWLAEKGYQIIRCGDPDMPEVAGPGVLDLAHHDGRTPLAEVYAIQHARLFIGCHSGPWAVALVCGVPSVVTNVSDPFAPYPLHGQSRYLLRPTMYRGGRPLSVLEQLEGGYLKAIMDTGYWRLTENPYALIHGQNSPEQILAAVQEVLAGLDNPPPASKGQVHWRQVAQQAAAHWTNVLPYVRKWAGSDGGWLGNGALAQVQAEGL